MKDMKYLVVSTENDCVYTYTPRALCAYTLTESIPDATVWALTYANTRDFDKFQNRDFFYEKTWKLTSDCRLVEVDESTITQEWLETREMVRLRQEVIYLWETYAAFAMSRTNQREWAEFNMFAYRELDKCDPDKNYYTPWIEEYAKVMENPTEQVYKELKLELDSDLNMKFRAQALTDKWKKRINAIKSKSEIQPIKDEMLREFWTNSYLS